MERIATVPGEAGYCSSTQQQTTYGREKRPCRLSLLFLSTRPNAHWHHRSRTAAAGREQGRLWACGRTRTFIDWKVERFVCLRSVRWPAGPDVLLFLCIARRSGIILVLSNYCWDGRSLFCCCCCCWQQLFRRCVASGNKSVLRRVLDQFRPFRPPPPCFPSRASRCRSRQPAS